MARPDKEAAVAALADKFRQADAVLLTEYRGLSVAQLKELRRSLAGNAEYTVVKNTLVAYGAKELLSPPLPEKKSVLWRITK